MAINFHVVFGCLLFINVSFSQNNIAIIDIERDSTVDLLKYKMDYRGEFSTVTDAFFYVYQFSDTNYLYSFKVNSRDFELDSISLKSKNIKTYSNLSDFLFKNSTMILEKRFDEYDQRTRIIFKSADSSGVKYSEVLGISTTTFLRDGSFTLNYFDNTKFNFFTKVLEIEKIEYLKSNGFPLVTKSYNISCLRLHEWKLRSGFQENDVLLFAEKLGVISRISRDYSYNLISINNKEIDSRIDELCLKE